MSDYSWKDSNLALFGSDQEKRVKKESAETEPAWAPVKNIDKTTTMVWRINKFKVEPVDPAQHGSFFSDDSYIVLHVEKDEGGQLLYDAHFWIGRTSTQDEYGTAAYKTVELDTFLDDKAVQHREVDRYESDKFKSYFERIKILNGGYASGFRHVGDKEFPERLMVFHGIDRHHIELAEVDFSKASLNSGDVFILDLGEEAYQWNGSGASKDEKFKASQFMQHLESERHGRCRTFVIDESDREETEKFKSMLPDKPVRPKATKVIGKKAIYKLSDESGSMKLSLVCEEQLDRKALTEKDPYFIDTGESLFVYIGNQCSRKEKQDALSHAHAYLSKTNHPFAPITVVSGGRNSKELEKVWG